MPEKEETNFSKPLLECPAQVSSREPPGYCPTKGLALLESLVGAPWDTVLHWGEGWHRAAWAAASWGTVPGSSMGFWGGFQTLLEGTLCKTCNCLMAE